MELNKIYQSDCLEFMETMPDNSVHCIVTSPPYWGLRDYGIAEQLGLEKTIDEYIAKMTVIFREARRILRKDGTLWLNMGDSYASGRSGQNGDICHHSTLQGGRVTSIPHKGAKGLSGLKEKDLIGMPWRIALSLQADGWYLRSDIVWDKSNYMPESVRDRPTKAHEYLFLMSKSARYYYDCDAIREPHSADTERRSKTPMNSFGRNIGDPKVKGSKLSYGGMRASVELNPKGKNKSSVWRVASQGFNGAHFATFPEKLITPCILAGCPKGGIVFDPFMGSGTTALVAKRLSCSYIGTELNPEYIEIAERRLKNEARLF